MISSLKPYGLKEQQQNFSSCIIHCALQLPETTKKLAHPLICHTFQCICDYIEKELCSLPKNLAPPHFLNFADLYLRNFPREELTSRYLPL